MNKYSELIEKISAQLDLLSNYCSSSYEVLTKAEKYSLVSGGKHLRGLIVLKCAMLGGAEVDKVINFACALEMIHTYSLVHDDLPEMDNDDFRRGVPTCHKKFGADIALLAGDALLTKAFDIVANDENYSSDIKIECIKILARACGEHGMLAGQTIDKCSENKQISYDELLELHSRKTGDMFCAAVSLGCVLGGVDTVTTQNLLSYIKELGLAFQIKDDILDVISTVEILGKPINSDEKSNKSTFISVLGLEESTNLLNMKVETAKKYVSNIKDQFFIDLADFFVNRTK